MIENNAGPLMEALVPRHLGFTIISERFSPSVKNWLVTLCGGIFWGDTFTRGSVFGRVKGSF